MGINKEAFKLLLKEKQKDVLKGSSILQLGRQCILFDENTLRKASKEVQVPLTKTESRLSFDSYYKKLSYIDDITLFKSLGFKEVRSLDFSEFEGADIVHDLNEPIPEKYWNQFDVIYDGGTAEHVFNIPQVLKNIYLMLKKEGLIIHVSPSHNHVDHGFYMFSPQLFFDYYLANQYDILTSQIFEYSPKYRQGWKFYDYHPGILHDLCYGGFGKKMLGIHLIAQKTDLSTFGAIPQQGMYKDAWSEENKGSQTKKKKIDPITRLGISLKKKLKRNLPFWLKFYLAKKRLAKLPKN